MSRSLSKRVPLEVRSASPATEIFVSDSSFRRIARGVDSLDLEVPPGFYKVRFRVGKSQHDELIEVPFSDIPIRVQGKPVHYRTAAPIDETFAAGARDARLAAELSRTVHRRLGRGSRLMLLARDLELTGDAFWDGVSIASLDGEPLVELAEGDCDPQSGHAGIGLELDPGTYRLRVDTTPLGVYEMFVVASSGWQIQVFALAENFRAAGECVRRPALRSASVLMARAERGFDPEADDLRLADLARIALGAGREIATDSDQQALEHGKFDDPMLGIYGAHLLLMAPRPDHALIDIMVGNLRELVGEHPDVEALELRSGESATATGRNFDSPPMLRSSWDLIVRASRRRISLVPSGSVSDRIGGNVVSSAPWLLHRVPDREAGGDFEGENVSFAQGRRLLEKLAMRRGSDELRERVEALTRDRKALSTLERDLLTAAVSQSGVDERATLIDLYGDASAMAKQKANRAIHSVDAPAVSIARSVRSLLAKLDLDVES